MSLVGPRAMSLRDYQLFDQDWQRRRFSVKPGITCLWQIHGRNSVPFEKWMELDMQYIDKWSLWLDLKILARTVPAVLRGTGAASMPENRQSLVTVNGSIQDLSRLSPSQRERLLERFNDDLIVKVLPSTQVVEIRFRSSDPALATDAANSIIDEYMQRNFHVRVDGTTQVSQWLSRQMDEIRAGTTAAQQKLADFQRENNLLGTDESDNIVTDRLKQLNEQLTQAEADRIVKEGRYRLARSGDPELIASVVPSTTLQVLRTQEADLQAQYAQMSAKFGKGYPKVRELQSQLARLEAAITTEGGNIETRLTNEYDAAAKAEAMIRDEFEQQKKRRTSSTRASLNMRF
jgi:uncharacterized protein involved in exopolysaccharide biosynthesis